MGLGRKNSGGSGPQKVSARDRAAKRFRPDQDAKEEGEISDTDEGGVQQLRGRARNKENTDRQSKEQKWHDWCHQMMEDQSLTLERLKKLQTNFSLPKEEVRLVYHTFWYTLDFSSVRSIYADRRVLDAAITSIVNLFAV